jgi:threonine/homoserine/homoserine lactone efflux protein
MISFLTTGTILGLSAGFTPGPLLTLVISETLKHDLKAGVKVALAPILTDLPIIILTLFMLAKLSHFHKVLGAISFLGGLFILYLGYESVRTKGVNIGLRDPKARSLRKGIIVNALSPYPYLFWFSVGAPTTIKAMGQSVFAAVAFVSSFYVLLVGSKIGLAILVGRSRSFLTGNPYVYTMRFLGLVLFVLAVLLFYDGLKLVGLL